MGYTGVGFRGVNEVNTGINCGDVGGMQQMLAALGFYPYPASGQLDQSTQAALVAYSISKGIQYDPSQPPSGAICAALIADYQAKQGGAAPAGPGPAGQCPPGTIGMPPYCVAPPGSLPTAPPPGATACPEGQVGSPPNCYAVPGLPGTLPTTPPGVPPQPGPPPPGVVPPPPATPPPPPGGGSFWAQRSDIEKVAIVAGGGLAVVLAVGMLGMKKKSPGITPNRRRRARRSRR